jgi:hypothetical protein
MTGCQLENRLSRSHLPPGSRPAAQTRASPPHQAKNGLDGDPGVWAYVFTSWSANPAAELSLGRADGGVCPYASRAGVSRRMQGQDATVDCRQDAGATFADYASAPPFWKSVAYGKQASTDGGHEIPTEDGSSAPAICRS